MDVVRAKSAPYFKGGKPIHRQERLVDYAFSIVNQYQQEFRGVVEYYRLAHNLSTRLNRLKWIMELSLAETLARKHRCSVTQIYSRYGTTIQTEQGLYKVLKVTAKREGKKPLVATWGGVPLTWRKDAILEDQPQSVWNARTELLERLLADRWELCGSGKYVQVHHLRSLKDLRCKGRSEKPEWVKAMASRQRKTLVVCRKCHQDIHAGKHAGDAKISGTRHRRAT